MHEILKNGREFLHLKFNTKKPCVFVYYNHLLIDQSCRLHGHLIMRGFPGGSLVKNPPANAGDLDSTPGSGRPPEGGNGSPLQYSCQENPMDREAWRATV